jgi:exodeoxyribonuclease V alpha subunit
VDDFITFRTGVLLQVQLQNPQITLIGKIATITYKSSETGFVVLRIEPDNGDFTLYAASGTMPDAQKGLQVELTGAWREHPKHGNQFNFTQYSIPEPDDESSMVAFLCTLKGIGEATAWRIVEKFGETTFSVLERGGKQLLDIKGIGPKTLPGILDSFQANKYLSDLIRFLHKIGVSAGYAPRLFDAYGAEAIAKIKGDPYILSVEVKGFGFKRADELALGLGIKPDSLVRTQAGLLHILRGAANMYGHCFLPRQELELLTMDLLCLPIYQPTRENIRAGIISLKAVHTHFSRRLVEEDTVVYLASHHEDELALAGLIKRLSGRLNVKDLEEWLDYYQYRHGIQLAAGQKQAVLTAISNGFVVITGGAGVGKSTVSKAIIQAWYQQNRIVIGIAPTGKAAQRIREATGLKTASTIHRLLGWKGTTFLHSNNKKISADAFLIDEASMMDLRLARALLEAIPRHAMVALVGDVDQLPSIGPGNVLRDIIESGEIPVTRLTEIFRQAETSRIIQASLSIKEGKMPQLERLDRGTDYPTSDALWINCSESKIRSALKWLITEKLPEMGWEKEQIQCLSPVHKGSCGNIELNKLIQEAWNPPMPHKPEFMEFRVGDRVIQTSNDYKRRVFNGDIGVIESINISEKEALVRFPDLDEPEEGRLVKYGLGDLIDDLLLAYSISVHKSQGSEFPVVVMPLSVQHYRMLQRNLLYTGFTRGKQLVVLIGEERPLQVAVRSDRLKVRNTRLAERIRLQSYNK